MDNAKLKVFAQEVRRDLIKQIQDLIEVALSPSGDLERSDPKTYQSLKDACNSIDKGKERVAEEAAYFWFNRLCALRFMDVNGYTGTGIVTPLNDDNPLPAILADAQSGYIDEKIIVLNIVKLKKSKKML
mgnify:CR=1 FL=1